MNQQDMLDEVLSSVGRLFGGSRAEAAVMPLNREAALALRATKNDPGTHAVAKAAHRRPETVTVSTRPMKSGTFGDFFPISRRILLNPLAKHSGLNPETLGHELMHFLATVQRSPYQRSETLAEYAGTGARGYGSKMIRHYWGRLPDDAKQAIMAEYQRVLAGRGGTGMFDPKETQRQREIAHMAREVE